MASYKILSETRLPHSIRDLVAYCDPHGFIAIATDTQDITVYRINGQIAFVIKRRDPDETITALAWKDDGSILAVGWSDGSYALHSGEKGRLLSQASVRADEEDDRDETVVTSFHFKRYSSSDTVSGLGDDLANLTTEAWADEKHVKGGKLSSKATTGIEKLARSVATMDVTTVLPRLSAIPSHGLRPGPYGAKFASQAATDTTFEVRKSTSADDVDTLLISCSDNTIHVLIDDTVKIGTWRLPSSANPTLQHATLSTLSSPLFHVIATNTKRLQTLVSYTIQTIDCIQHDFTTGLQFPTRLMSNISEELGEKEEGDLVTNLYHLSMTGEFTPTMLEWLTDIVKETNHKRWHTAVCGMYENIMNHLFISLKPALDRLSIAATELRGQASFHDGTSKFEVEPELFTSILDGIDSIRLVSQKLLLVAIDENKKFKAFSKWLRIMIEIGACGPGTKAAWEAEERENPNVDYPLVWQYLETTMGRSKMQDFLSSSATLDQEPKGDEMGIRYEKTKEAITAYNASPDNTTPHLSLPSLLAYTTASVHTALGSIAAWQSRTLAPPVTIGDEPPAQEQEALPGLELSFEPKRYLHGGRKGREICVVLGERQWVAIDMSSRRLSARTGVGAEDFGGDDVMAFCSVRAMNALAEVR